MPNCPSPTTGVEGEQEDNEQEEQLNTLLVHSLSPIIDSDLTSNDCCFDLVKNPVIITLE
jgi:hypothetical protein